MALSSKMFGQPCRREKPLLCLINQLQSSAVHSSAVHANKGLRLVNSRWNSLVTPLIYRNIHLFHDCHVASLLPTLRQVPDLGILIQTLTITIPPSIVTLDMETYSTHRFLRKLFQKNLPALKQLHLHTVSFMAAMTYLKDSIKGNLSLTHLSIQCHGPRAAVSTGYIWSILWEFPLLEEFWFEFRGDDGVVQETMREMPKKLYLPSMRKLGISGAMILDDTVEELCCICPNLTELEIDGENRFCII
jgi:hypothetical protein